MNKTFRDLLSLIDKRNRTIFFLLPLLMLVVATMEMASIGMIIPVLHIIIRDPNTPSFPLFQSIEPFFREMSERDTALVVCGTFVLIFLIKTFAVLFITYIINRFTLMNLSRFMQRLFRGYMSLPYTVHIERNTSEMMRNLTTASSNAFQGFRMLLNLVLEGFLAFGAFAVIFWVEPLLVAGVALVFGSILGATHWWLVPHIRAWGDAVNQTEAIRIRTVNQSLGAIKEVKIRHCEEFLSNFFGRLTDHMSRLQLLNVTVQDAPRLLIEFLAVCGLVSVILLAVWMDKPGPEVISLISVVGMAAMRLIPSMNRILSNANGLRFLDAYLASLSTDIQESTQAAESQRGTAGREVPFRHDIRLDGVVHRYPRATTASLAGIDLTLRKGETLGIVGPSGSGKTTLVDVLLGLLTPSQGHVSVDGNDISDRRRDWWSKFGYVSQDIYVLDDTVRRNIAFGREDQEIDEARVETVIRQAHLESVIAALPNGLDTFVGERGGRLSGGERQRIGIARALYTDPEILIFDEATSALDNESEREVKLAIDGLTESKTVIIIAHRLSTIRNCQRLLFMKGGRIVADGSFDTLYQTDPAFRQFVNAGELGALDSIPVGATV